MAKMKNCPMCGKIFVPLGTAKYCPDCQDKMREKEAEVVNYVRDNPKCKVSELIEATGAPESMIKRLIREGRFEQVGVQMSYPCEKCGKPIYTGKFCAECMESMRKEVQAQTAKFAAASQAAKPAAGGRGGGMYTKKFEDK